jgi:hypothetical protein
MAAHQPRRAVLLLAAAGLVASCAVAATSFLGRALNLRPGNPDPGNRRLHALAADPVFAGLPPGAVRTGRQENSPKWRSGFFTGSWQGPSVVLTFTSPQPVLEVYRFYDQRARQAGWAPWQKLSNGLTWSWLKHIAGEKSYLGLWSNFDIHSVGLAESGITRSYSLTGAT